MEKCNVCGAIEFLDLNICTRDNLKNRVVKCNVCGHVQLKLYPSVHFYDDNTQLKRIYKNLDINKLKEKSQFDTKRRLKYLVDNCDLKKDFLEVGIGYGFLLEEMLGREINVDGIEIGEERRSEVEKRLGKKILDIDLTTGDAKRLKKKYDYILLFQVLEHIEHPIPFLESLYNLLTERGKIIVEVPNHEDFLLSVSESYESFYYQEAHVSYFNSNILQKIVKEAGFVNYSVQYCQRYSINNFMHWLVRGTPQIDRPAYEADKKLEWLNNSYKEYLISNGKTDTIIFTADKRR